MEPLEGCRNDTLVFLSLSKCLITENTLMIICKSFLGYDKKNFEVIFLGAVEMYQQDTLDN